jgi:hypothetical protein
VIDRETRERNAAKLVDGTNAVPSFLTGDACLLINIGAETLSSITWINREIMNTVS